MRSGRYGRIKKDMGCIMLAQSHADSSAGRALSTAVCCTVEALENRRLLAVDAAGWTVLSPGDDSRVIYVDNTPGIGKDTNSGTLAAPVFSFDRAVSLTRPNSPDWILLKRGTVHNRAVSNWSRSG